MAKVSSSPTDLASAAHPYKTQNWVDFICVAAIAIAGFFAYEDFTGYETLLSFAYIAGFVLTFSVPLRIFRIAASSKSTLNFVLLCAAGGVVGLVLFLLYSVLGLMTVKM